MTRQSQSRAVTYRYSEAFKQKVVNEIEAGHHSIYSAKRAYGISGAGTLYYWIKKMGKLTLLNKIVRIEMPQEKDQIKELQHQIKELKEALVKMQVKQLRTDCDLEVAMEMLGYKDMEEFKKKLKRNPSTKR